MFRKDSITNISNIQLCDYEPGLASIIQSALAGCKLLPDDWALIQESLPANDAVVTLFRQHRQTISRQLVINNKNQLAVPLIYFSHDNQSYVLLMKNIGLTAAAKPEQLQWTAHSTRVDEHEYELMQDDDMWKLCEDMSNGDEITPYYIAAIVRRLKELGIKVSATDIKKIHPIDRIGAGLPESDDHYCTEFFYVNLGERNPEDLMRACHQQTASRFAQWTHCFKMSELQEIKRDATFKPEGKYNERFIFNYEGTNYPIRFTTWSFIKALQLLQEHTILPDGGDKDPWTLQNITSYERALQWVRNRLDSDVQISIFSEKNNWLSSPKLHAYAAKTGINVEHLAYSSLRPERLVLHAIIANLTVKTIVNHKSEFDQQVTRLYRYFFANNPLIMEQWECELQQTRIDSIEDTEKINHIISNIRKIADHYIETGLYHVNESDQDIAEIIVKHDKYHQAILPIIMSMVNNMIDAAIEQGDFKPLTRFPVDKRQCFGVTGPVASGKSSSEELARDELQGQPAAFISSDEWNGLLSANLNISEFNMQRGKLTLAEAWCVKCLIWDMMHKMEQAGSAPNWIQEACDPASIKAPALARTIIYINTSNPIAAVERVKARGLKCGR